VTSMIPKALYVVVSDPNNPHVLGGVEIFRRKRAAERACKWGDQKLVVYVPQARSHERP
jgi:hypothetical protein